MKFRRAFTLVELGVVLLVCLVAFLLIVQATFAMSRASPRTMCGGNLRRIAQSAAQYAVEHRLDFPIAEGGRWKYPTAGAADPAAKVIGFREGDRRTGKGATLDNNLTASLWILVRAGHVTPEYFVCPQTRDEPDPLTISLDNHDDAEVSNTFDFLERRNLSYSPINMYYPQSPRRWTSRGMSGQSVWIADNNANDYAGLPARHTLAAGAAGGDVVRAENSPNHKGEGQNFGFGDGHVSYDVTPFVGLRGDNVYAMARDGANVPPSVSAVLADELDVALIPLSGNGGGDGSVSGLPLDVEMALDPDSPLRFWLNGYVWLMLGAVMVVVALASRPRKRNAHAG